MSDDLDDDRPTGFMGRLGRARALTWIVIIGLVALSIGAISFVIVLQSSL
ncbi:hypothetical protein N1031_08015 [Herbiconiux moechotypicola]|uniref:Uncharacterized protein n=1 Tax=Herbiconiux moechotypicola TaxID=637393 RepID=A0ABP5QFN4_9MICO|nr:hypothetical protein [Herbiconiux moechotypicola]MCS5729705.1 hypothetical protein [Herbiconiux moechotypicola]